MIAQTNERAAAANSGRRLKLLVVVTRIDVGGVPEHILILLDHLRYEYDVTVACREVIPEHRQRLERMGVRIEPVDLARLPNPVRDLRALLRLAAFIRRERFDIVHGHMSKGAMIGGFAARLARAPLSLTTAHNFGWLALPNPAMRAFFWLYDKSLFALTLDRLVTVSRFQREQIVNARLIADKRVHTVWNGIDAAGLRRRAQDGVGRADIGVGEDKVLVITVARLVWFKAIDRLIEAVALLGREAEAAQFIVLGDGDQRPRLQRLIDAQGLGGRVRLLGARHDIPRLLALSDIFALPSVSEGMPIAVMEAMAVGLPVVATAVDGTPEVVADGETGLLVPPRDPAALAAALQRLIGDRDLRRRLGERGRARIEQHFTDRAMAANTDALYRKLLAAKRGAGAIAGVL